MTRPLRRALSCFVVSAAAAALAAACSSQAGSPVAPSSTALSSGSGVTIVGQVAGSSTAERASASASHLTVSVVGTGISTPVQGNGKFTLENVPAGDVSLQFTGPGTNAKLTIGGLSEGQQVQITVSVSGSNASIENEQSSHPGESGVEIEGLIASIDTAGQALVVNGKTISVPTTATIRHGGTSVAFADLEVGQRVHVKGTTQGTQIVATEVMLQNEQTSTEPGDDQGDDDGAGDDDGLETELTGTLAAAPAGTCPTVSFTLGTTSISTTSTTAFRHGACTDLATGSTVEVKGTQTSTGVIATQVSFEGGSNHGHGD